MVSLGLTNSLAFHLTLHEIASLTRYVPVQSVRTYVLPMGPELYPKSISGGGLSI